MREGGGMFIGNLSIVTSSVVCWLLLRFIDSYSVVGINISKIGIIVHIKEKCTVTKSRGKILMLLICNKIYLICINTSCAPRGLINLFLIYLNSKEKEKKTFGFDEIFFFLLS